MKKPVIITLCTLDAPPERTDAEKLEEFHDWLGEMIDKLNEIKEKFND